MKTNFISVNTHIKKNQTLNKKDNTILKINGVIIEEVKSMKYLGNYVTSNLTNNEHLTNRIRLAVTTMLKLNEAGYDESLDAFAAIQLYKTYGRPTILYGVESLNLNTKQTDRLTACETSIFKRILKLAPFHHSDLLLH